MKNKLTDIKNYIELKQKLLVNEINSFCIQIIDIINITPDNKPNMPNLKYDDIIEIKSTDFDINKKMIFYMKLIRILAFVILLIKKIKDTFQKNKESNYHIS